MACVQWLEYKIFLHRCCVRNYDDDDDDDDDDDETFI